MAEDSEEIRGESELTEKEVILLGLLAEEPIHAYGLEEKIRFRKMDLWTSISFSSIYRVLAGLEDKGLIDTHLEHEGQGATRKMHTITAEGKQALAGGVLSHLRQMVPIKNPFSVGLAYIYRAPLEDARRQLTARKRGLEEAEQEISESEERMLNMVESSPHHDDVARSRARLVVNLVLSCARHHIQAERRFISATIERLEKEDPRVFAEIPEGTSDPLQEDEQS